MARIGLVDSKEIRRRFAPWFKDALDRSGLTPRQIQRKSMGGRCEAGRVATIRDGVTAVTPDVAMSIAELAEASVADAIWHSYPHLALALADSILADGKDLEPARRWHQGDHDADTWAEDVMREPNGHGAAMLYCFYAESTNKLLDALLSAMAKKNMLYIEKMAGILHSENHEIFEPRLRVAAVVLREKGIDFGLRRATTLVLVQATARSRAAGLFDDALTEWHDESPQSLAPVTGQIIAAGAKREPRESPRF